MAWAGIEQGLNRGWTGVVQRLFNVCSTACKRLSPCVVVVGVRGEHECGCGSGFCFVSHEFCFLRVEIRVYWGRCFSWKAWQKNPDALCGGASGKVFGCLQRRFFFHLCDYYIGDCAGEMASDEACGRKAGAAAAEESLIWFAHSSAIYANIWKKRKFIHLFLELCIESRSFADEK